VKPVWYEIPTEAKNIFFCWRLRVESVFCQKTPGQDKCIKVLVSRMEKAHSFIVRIWLEPRESQAALPEWRGVVEHVQSGDRSYLRDLGELSEFIQYYLIKMGLEVTRGAKVWDCLKRALSNLNPR